MCYHFLRTCVAVALLTTTPATYSQPTDLPDIGGVANTPSPVDERRTGQAVMRNLRRAGALVDDLLANDYINKLGYQLLSAHSETEHEFHFFLVNDKSINAFALPGGYIGINYGLILSSRSEDELAAVMAHEIAHVTQKHHSRGYAHQTTSQIPVIAAIIAAAVLGDAQVGQAAIASTLAIQAERQLSFTRSNEREADRIGIQLLADAGFNPLGMVDFFKRLDDQSRLYGSQAPEFLRTHPVNVNRITDAHHRARQVKLKINKNSQNYTLIHNRLQVLSAERPSDILSTYHLQYKNSPKPEIGTKYGYLLAQLENKDFKAAQQSSLQFGKSHAQQLTIQLAILKATIQLKPTAALKQYQELLQYYPNNPALVYDYTDALLKLEKATKAQKILNHYLKKHSEHPVFFRLLSKTESLLGNQTASHQAMAEYYYQIGQIHQAIQQLDLALKASNVDFYRLNQIEARQVEFKEELLQLNALNSQ